MPENLCQFEFLPNEILFNIFQYFDADDLYRAFYNLNFRFNSLLRSLKNLSLTLLQLHPDERHPYQLYSPSIYTLKLGYKANINLNDFPNVRRLELFVPTVEQLKQLQSDIYHSLEYLSIGYKHILSSDDLPNLTKKIFSNGFPYLKSCDLFEPKTIFIAPSVTQSPGLRNLKVDHINFTTYQMILSTCPNLCFLQFTTYFPWKEAYFIKSHVNLQRLTIKFDHFISSMNTGHINDYLRCVPTLKQLIIYTIDYADNIKVYFNYNWLTLFNYDHLPLLQQVKFYLTLVDSKQSFRHANKDVRDRLIENFKQIHHQHRYRAELHLNLSTFASNHE